MRQASSNLSHFLRGVGSGAPFLLVILPFGMIFGVVATEAGLPLVQVMAMTVLVIAGASQFSAVALMQDNAPTIVILATSLTVNLRMAMYSAALVPHFGKAPFWQRAFAAYGLVDQCYAVVDATYGDDTKAPWQERLSYYFGCLVVIVPFWYIGTYIGAIFGAKIPPEFALDFALPVCFLATIGPSLRRLPHVFAAFLSAVCSLLFFNFPFGLGLISAGIVGIVGAVWLELKLERRA